MRNPSAWGGDVVRTTGVIGMGLAVHRPSTVWAGTYSTGAYPADGTGIGQVTVVTTTSGDVSAARDGMVILLSGYYTYLRKTPIAGTIYIDGLGAGTLSTGSFQVIDSYMPFPRRHRYSGGAWYMNFDHAYTDENENFGPQAVMGPAAVIYADGAQTFGFDGSRCVAHSPGSTITSYLWEFPDATTSALQSPTWATSTAYPNGAWVHLTVTDSNGDTHTGHRLLFKFDSSNKPKTDFEIQSLSGEWGDGWTCQLKSADTLFATINSGSNYYDAGNHVVLFGDTTNGNGKANSDTNFPNRENIYLDGYITSDEYDYRFDYTGHTYTLETVDGLLKRQHGFPVYLEDNAAPSTWLHMKDITLDRAAWHLCRWRSTIGDVADVYLCGNTAATRAKAYTDLRAGTLWEQLKQIYQWLIGGQVSCDSLGAIYCEQDVIISGDGPYDLTLFFEDSPPDVSAREGYGVTNVPTYLAEVAKFTAYGVNYATPVGSRSPDDPAAHGAALEEISAGIHATQAELNAWSGNRRAQLNAYTRARFYPLNGLIRLDPTPQCKVEFFNCAAAPDLTGIKIVRSCSIEFDAEHGMAWSEIEVETDITGIDGQTISFTAFSSIAP